MFLIKYRDQSISCDTYSQVQRALDMIWDVPRHITQPRMPREGESEVYWSPDYNGEASYQIIVYNLGD